MRLLEMNHIKKSFDGQEVLKDISIHVDEGEVLSIIGPSGSGKSTMLRCATMLETIDDGAIIYLGDKAAFSKDGHAVYAKAADLKKIHSYYGLVFQNFNLFPHFSVLRNITEAQRLVLGRSKKEAEEIAMDLLGKMSLSSKALSYPCELSGGQQQRVSIARALALNPRVLFFDEPTSALDPELTGEILQVIKDLANQKMTMVVVTHEMAFARDISNHLIFMDGGVIVEQGNPTELMNNPKEERTIQFLKRFNEK